MAYEKNGVWYGSDGRAHGNRETAEADDAARKRVASTDWESVRKELESRAKGIDFTSELEGIQRHYGYDVAEPLDKLKQDAFAALDRRNAPSGNDDDEEDRGSDGGGNDNDREERDYAPPLSSRTSGSSGGGGGSNADIINAWSQVSSAVTAAAERQNALLQESANKQYALMEQLRADEKSRLDEQRAIERQRMAEAAAAEAERKAKADELYGQLKTRATASTNVSAADPNIRAQVDPYRAERTRAMRGYLSDVAEAEGPLGNTRGEQRIAAERTGADVASYQAQILGNELSARRGEIVDAINSMRGMLTADQQATLQREVDALDNQIAAVSQTGASATATGSQGLGLSDLLLRGELGRGGLSLQDKLGTRGLDIQELLGTRDLDIKELLGTRGLDIQELLGTRGLDLQALAQEIQDRQFYDDLGFRVGDRRAYWDALYGGQFRN